MRRLRAMIVALAALALLAACAQSTVVRRYDDGASYRRAPLRGTAGSGEYVVARGDTLYGIAFRYGADWRDVAAWNGIVAPYTIYPGQKLRLRTAGAAATTTQRPTPTPVRQVVTASPRTLQSTPTRPPVATQPPGTTPPAPVKSSPPVPANDPVRWHWPAQGQLVGRFVNGDPTRQGLDIAGNGGQAVNAAADGVVVYSGAGLVGYGELVIVKHTDEWLSAYGHNRKRLVSEGQTVKAGEQIAEMGRTGASRDMLHFEIRRNGRPVDPLPLLPPR